MKKLILSLLIFAFTSLSFAQIVTTEPQYPTQNDSIVVIFDATQPGAVELLNYTVQSMLIQELQQIWGSGSM